MKRLQTEKNADIPCLDPTTDDDDDVRCHISPQWVLYETVIINRSYRERFASVSYDRAAMPHLGTACIDSRHVIIPHSDPCFTDA
jgi:hypothetical protein